MTPKFFPARFSNWFLGKHEPGAGSGEPAVSRRRYFVRKFKNNKNYILQSFYLFFHAARPNLFLIKMLEHILIPMLNPLYPFLPLPALTRTRHPRPNFFFDFRRRRMREGVFFFFLLFIFFFFFCRFFFFFSFFRFSFLPCPKAALNDADIPSSKIKCPEPHGPGQITVPS